MDLTPFMGLVTIMTGFGWFNADLGVHIVVMLLATAVAHVVPAVMRRRPQAERTLLPYAVATPSPWDSWWWASSSPGRRLTAPPAGRASRGYAVGDVA